MYRIARSPEGHLRWWLPEETLPDGHAYIRNATDAEVAQIDEILAGNATFDDARMDAAAEKLAELPGW